MIHLPNSTYVELYSEMAAAILLDHHSGSIDIYVTEENGDVRYTGDAQELFNEYCELVEGVLETVGIGQEPASAPAMKELVFYNRDNPSGLQLQTISCSADAVEQIVQWYGGFHAGDRVTLHIDGFKANLDSNLKLAIDPRTEAL
jgi:hypothetical protein